MTIDTLTYMITGDTSQLVKALEESQRATTDSASKSAKAFANLEKSAKSKVDSVVNALSSLSVVFKSLVENGVSAEGVTNTLKEAFDNVAQSIKLSSDEAKVFSSYLDGIRSQIIDASSKEFEGYAFPSHPEGDDSGLQDWLEKNAKVRDSIEQRLALEQKDAEITDRTTATIMSNTDKKIAAIKEQAAERKAAIASEEAAAKAEFEGLQQWLKAHAPVQKTMQEIANESANETKAMNESAQVAQDTFAEKKKALLEEKAAQEALNAAIEDEEEKRRYAQYWDNLATKDEYEAILNKTKEMNAEADRITNHYDQQMLKLKEHKSLYDKIAATASKLSGYVDKYTSGLRVIVDLLGTKVSFSWFKELAEEAGAAEKAITQLGAVYGDYVEDALASSKAISSSYGLSIKDTEKMISYVGQLLTNQGISSQNALTMAENIVKLGVDLQSLTQGADNSVAAIEALSRALLGSAKSAYTLGVSFTDADIQQQLKMHNIETDAVSGTEKVVARYYALLEKTKTAQGNYALNSGNLANIQQSLNASWNDLCVTIGNDFLPVLKDVYSTFDGLVSFIGSDGAFATGLRSSVEFLAVAAAGLIAVSGAMAVAKRALSAFNKELGTTVILGKTLSTTTVIGGVITLIAAVAGVAKGIAQASENASDLTEGVSKVTEALDMGKPIDNVEELNKTWAKQSKTLDSLNRLVSSYNREIEESPDDANREALLDAVKEKQEEIAKIESNRKQNATDIAKSYIAQGENMSLLNGLSEEFKNLILETVDALKEAADAGITLDDEVRMMSMATQNWEEMIEKADEHLKRAMEAANKHNKEYGKTLSDNIKLLREQHDEYEALLEAQAKYVTRDMDTTDQSAVIARMSEAVAQGLDVIPDDWFDGLLEPGSEVANKIAYITDSMLKSQRVFNTESEAYMQEYTNSIEKEAESLSNYIDTLMKKTNTTIEEQRDAALINLSSALSNAVGAAYGKIGGLADQAIGGVFDVDAFTAKLKEFASASDATLESVMSNISEYLWDTTDAEAEAQSFYGELVPIVKAYLSGLLDVNTEYNEKYKSMQEKYSEEILNLELSATGTTYKRKQEIALEILKLQHDAEYASLVKELGKEENATGEALKVFEQFHAKVSADTANLVAEQARAIADITRNLESMVAQQEVSMATGLREKLDLELDMIEKEREQRIALAEETGEDENTINEYYDNQIIIKNNAYYDTLKSNREKHALNMLNLEKSSTKSLKGQMDLQLQITKASYDERIKNAAKTGENVADIEAEWKLAQANITASYDDKIAEIERNHKRTMLNFEIEAALTTQQQWELRRQLVDDEYQYRIDHAEETGENVADIEEEWNAKRLADAKSYYSEMRSEIDKMSDYALNAAKRSADKEANIGSGIFSFFNIQGIQEQGNVETANAYKEMLGNLDKDAQEKWDKYVTAKGENPILQWVTQGLTPEEIQSKLTGVVGIPMESLKGLWDDLMGDIEKVTEDTTDKIIESLEDSVNSLVDFFDQINTIQGMFSDNKETEIRNRMAEFQKQYDEFSDALSKANSKNEEHLTRKEKDERERRKKMDEDEMERLQSLIDEEEAALEEQERKSFEREKAFAIGKATISGLVAVANALAESAYPINLVNAALVGALSAAQVAAIASQPFPSYAVGAYDLPQDQMAQVHKGEMIIPRPFAEEIRDNGGLGGAITVNVYGAESGASVEGSSRDDTRQIDIYVSSKVKSMVAKGELDGVLQTRYTLNRNGKRG